MIRPKRRAIASAVSQALTASSLVASSSSVCAQSSANDKIAQAAQLGLLEEVVVTASPGANRSQLETAASVTSIGADLIEDFQPTSESEVLRMIPGIQVAGTVGPGGNANIAVRGLAVATGGAPFIQIQEDGLPTVLFGDIQFGNNDYWTRFDESVQRVEGVRGGTAATFASQAPGAIVNYISRTGREEGGQVALTTGIGFDEQRFGFRYGGSLGDALSYHVGAYFKQGQGPYRIGFNASDSVQIKANLTRDFSGSSYEGHIRFHVKLADTQEPNYTGSPALVDLNGRSADNIRAFPGFDGRSDSTHSIHNQEFLIVNRSGDLERVSMVGIATQALALGNELRFDFDNGLSLDNKMRWTDMSGQFTNPFVNAARADSVIGSTVNGATVAAIRYANGPNRGRPYTGTYLDNNTNVSTNMRDVGSFVNDLTLSMDFDLGNNLLSARAGYFYMVQDIAMDWHTNQTLKALSGDNPAMLDLYDAAGAQLTANGISGYNNNWGTCCARDYDLSYTDTAPYLALEFDNSFFTVDASVRFENIRASGFAISGGEEFFTPTETRDFNGNPNTVRIPTLLANGASESLDYTVDYETWTLGGLWKLSDNISLFARISEGARFNADRQTVSGKINADGSLNQAGRVAAVDEVNQAEIGIKTRGELWGGDYTAELTLLDADYAVSTFELSATVCGGPGGCVIDEQYRSTGAEFFVTYAHNNLSITGNATYTDAQRRDAKASAFVRAQAVPDLQYTIAASYFFGNALNVGLNLSGQTDSVDRGLVEYAAGAIFGGHIRYTPIDNLEFSLTGYNLSNAFEIRGNASISDGAAAPALATVSPVLGRTIRAGVKFFF